MRGPGLLISDESSSGQDLKDTLNKRAVLRK